MFFEWGNENTVRKSCLSYAIIRVISVRVMRSLLYTVESPHDGPLTMMDLFARPDFRYCIARHYDEVSL